MTKNHNSLQAKAVAYIQQQLISGELAWGSLVSEEAIAQKINISRTPVREALQIFTRLGFFRRIPRYGTIVREPDLREMRELFEMRVALESYAVEEAVKVASEESLKKAEEYCQEIKMIGKKALGEGRNVLTVEEVAQTLKADLNFHLEIIRSIGNSMMVKYLTDTNIFLRIFTSRRTRRFDLNHLAGAYGYHCRILRAIKKRNAEQAKRLMIRHIRLSEEGAIELMKDLLEESRRRNISANTESSLLD